MNEHLDNVWKEFERTGEVCNSAEQLLNLAGDLTEQNKLLREVLAMIIEQTENGFTVCESCGHEESTETQDVLWMATEALEATK